MKKTLFAIAALAAMTSCSQEMTNIELQQPKGQTVKIEAAINSESTPDTKTTLGETTTTGTKVLWEDTDEMSVIVKLPTTALTYTAGTKFTRKTADGANAFEGTFATTDKGPAASGLNTYYATYPFNANINTIGEDPSKAGRLILKKSNGDIYRFMINPTIQNGIDDMKHIVLPFYGTGVAEGTAMPKITMKHLCAVVKVAIKNPGKTDLVIKNVKITVDGAEKLSGGFAVNVEGDYPLLGSASAGKNYAETEVKNGTIQAGATGNVYILTSRFRSNSDKDTAKHSTKLTVRIDTDKDYMEKVITIDNVKKPVKFLPGTINSTTLDYVKTGDLIKEELDILTTPVIDFSGITTIPNYFTDKGTAKIVSGKLAIPTLTDVIISTKSVPTKMVIETTKTNGIIVNVSADGGNNWTEVLNAKKPAADKTSPVRYTIDLTTVSGKHIKIGANKGGKPLEISKIDFTPAA